MFSLTLLSSLLTDFLQNDLPCLAATGSVDAQYRLSSVCRSCEYESDCRTRTLEEDTLSKIPYLAESTHAAALHTLGNQNSFARLVLEVLDAVPPGVVEAYQTQSPVLIPDARSRLIPISEDVSVFLTLAVDPFLKRVYAWSIRVSSTSNLVPDAFHHHFASPQILMSTPLSPLYDLVLTLSGILDGIPGANDVDPPSAQIYLWSRSEVTTLLDSVIAVATTGLDSAAAEAAQRLALAFVNDARILATTVLPNAVGAALESGTSSLRKHQVIDRLRRYGVSFDPSDAVKNLKKILKDVIEDNRSAFSCGSRLTPLEPAVAKLIALPVPGYYTLADVRSALVPNYSDHSDDEETLYVAYQMRKTHTDDGIGEGTKVAAKIWLEKRTLLLSHILTKVREMVTPLGALVLAASPLEAVLPLHVQDGFIRRLIFMRQFEMLQEWSDLVNDRIAFPGASKIVSATSSPSASHDISPLSAAVAANAIPQRPHPGKVIIVRVLSPPRFGRESAYGNRDWKFSTELRVAVESGLEYVESDDLPNFVPWLLSGGDDVLSPVHFPDVKYHGGGGMWPKGLRLQLAFAAIYKVHRSDDGSSAELDLLVHTSGKAPKKGKAWFKPGDLFVLRERGRDFTTNRVVSHLYSLDAPSPAESSSPFLSLIADPAAWAASMPPAPVVPDLAKVAQKRSFAYRSLIQLGRLDRKYNLNLGQAKVLRGFLSDPAESPVGCRLQLVWGPPGTGKTHAIALILLRLIEAHAIAAPGTPFSVLITGFTNAAIENVLARIVKIRDVFGSLSDVEGPDWTGMTFVGKIASTSRMSVVEQEEEEEEEAGTSSAGEESTTFDENTYDRLMDAASEKGAQYRILGGTVYQIDKQLGSGRADGFEMVVIDEGSQLPVAETALAVQMLRRGGRILVAGDHMQLPPIIRQKYPETEGMPALFSSILHCLLRTSENGAVELSGDVRDSQAAVASLGHVVQLTTNYRMNSMLSEFTRALYANYDCMNTEQALALNASELDEDLVARSPAVITTSDPDLSLVAVRLVLEPDTAWMGMRSEDLVLKEAKVVADICQGLYQSWPEESDVGTPEDGVFVVTPHRSQKAMVEAALGGPSAVTRADGSSRVDTVEKMQGREVEVVVAAFGFFNPFRIQAEAEFLYSRNRLNVAISRARNKAILIYTDAVLSPPASVYESESVRDALEYLQRFVSSAVKVDWHIRATPAAKGGYEEEEEAPSSAAVSDVADVADVADAADASTVADASASAAEAEASASAAEASASAASAASAPA